MTLYPEHLIVPSSHWLDVPRGQSRHQRAREIAEGTKLDELADAATVLRAQWEVYTQAALFCARLLGEAPPPEAKADMARILVRMAVARRAAKILYRRASN